MTVWYLILAITVSGVGLAAETIGPFNSHDDCTIVKESLIEIVYEQLGPDDSMIVSQCFEVKGKLHNPYEGKIQ